jgi:hypothetical protein
MGNSLSVLHSTALCRGSTGGLQALLASPQMKGMIGERFHASDWRGPDRFSNTLAFCLTKPSIFDTKAAVFDALTPLPSHPFSPLHLRQRSLRFRQPEGHLQGVKQRHGGGEFGLCRLAPSDLGMQGAEAELAVA